MKAIMLAVTLIIGTAIAAPEPDPQFFGGNLFSEFPFGGVGGPFGFVNDIFSKIAAGKGGVSAPISPESVQDGYRGDDAKDNNFGGFPFGKFFEDFFDPSPSDSGAGNSTADGSKSGNYSYDAPPPVVVQASAFAGPAPPPPSSSPAPPPSSSSPDPTNSAAATTPGP